MLLSVAVGRIEYWTSGLERHYGIFGVVLAIVSWTTISLHMRRTMVSIYGSLFLCVNLYLYVVNFDWRAAQTNKLITNTVDLYGDISKGIVIDRFVENHIRKLYLHRYSQGKENSEGQHSVITQERNRTVHLPIGWRSTIRPEGLTKRSNCDRHLYTNAFPYVEKELPT